MTAVVRPWLWRAYAASLAVHAAVVLALLVLAVVSATGGGADSAPDTLLYAIVLMVPVLLGAVPSAIALLSWRLCRGRGVEPSPGHMGLVTAAAAAWLVALAAAPLR